MDKRLLIIEDNANLCYLYAKSFEKRGFIVELAHDGQQAINKFTQFKPQIVLCDIKMPHVSGLDVIALMNTYTDLRRNAIILIISAYDSPDLIHRAQQLGVTRDKYLVKSQVSLSEMMDLVQAYC